MLGCASMAAANLFYVTEIKHVNAYEHSATLTLKIAPVVALERHQCNSSWLFGPVGQYMRCFPFKNYEFLQGHFYIRSRF